MIEPRAWSHQKRGPKASKDQPSDVIRFEHITRAGRGVLVTGQYLPQRDEWWLRVLVNGKEVDTRITTEAYDDAVDLLTAWR